MAAFKKSFLVLAVALLALVGTTGTANAQFHPGLSCSANATPAQARAEGIAELLGDILLTCSYAAGISPSGLAYFQATIAVTLNVNVTNNIDFTTPSDVTDAILELNNNTVGPPVATQGSLTSTTPMYGRRSAPATLTWIGANFPNPTIDPDGVGGLPANPAATIIRITNMRGNVSQLGIPSGEGAFPTAQVTGFVSVAGQAIIPVSNNVLNVGVPLLGLLTRFRGPAQADVTRPIIALQCVTLNLDSDNDIQSTNGGDYPAHDTGAGSFSVRLSEGFASAFKTLGTPTISPALATAFGQEDGYPTPPSGVNGGGATQGTRFILRFYNVPSGVRLATPNIVRGTSGGGHTLTIVKVAGTDANGAGSLGAVTTTPPIEVSISGGFGFVIYEVVDENPFAIENVTVNVTAAFRANTTNDQPAVGTLQMSASFAPISTVTTSSNSAPEPRFVDTGALNNMLAVARCNSTLLYPFVTNQAGFDTGFSIANTTRDPFGTPAQAGTCTLNYYGSTTGGGAAPAAQTSAVVASGSHIVWTLSGGNAAANITGTPGFQGYIIAVCQFQFAHGFAFITDGFGGVPAIAEGYLALIIPNPTAFAATAGRQASPSGLTAAGTGESLSH